MSDARETEMLRSGPYLQGTHNLMHKIETQTAIVKCGESRNSSMIQESQEEEKGPDFA